MILTVLGKYGPWPGAGGACSGYLLEAGGRRLLLDCGCGVLGRLQRHCGIDGLDGVALSHLHGDHMGDIPVLRYALPYFLGNGRMRGKLPVFLPGAPADAAGPILADASIDGRPVSGGERIDFMGLRLSFFPVRHPVPCNAVKVECEGRAFVYSGDMNTTPGFESFVQSADLLLIDGCLRASAWDESKPHLSARLAAELGGRAGVKRLVVTHVHPEDDESLLLAEARQAFPEAALASEGMRYDIG